MEGETIKISDHLKEGLSQKAAESLDELAAHLSGALAEQRKKSTADIEELQKALKVKGEELQISKDLLGKLEEALGRQEKAINRIQQTGFTSEGKSKKRIEEEFAKNFHKLQNASKTNEVTLVGNIKAIDEHNPDLIITTGNAVTSTIETDWTFELYGERPGFFRKRRPLEYLRAIANITQVRNLPPIFRFYEEGGEEGSFAVVDENGLKPQVKVDLILNSVDRQKVAGYIVVTEELLKDMPRAWAALQRLFRDKFERDYLDILTTALETSAITYPGTALDGTIADPTDADAIGAAAAAVEIANFNPDTLIINPADKWRILLNKGNDGQFMFPAFAMSGSEPNLFGLNVITSTKITAGTFEVGQSGTWYIEEEAPTIRSGWVNDDFIHNRMTIVMENFFFAYVPSVNQGSWIKGNFADIKDLLQA